MVGDTDLVGAIRRDCSTKRRVIMCYRPVRGTGPPTPCLFYDAPLRIPPLVWRHCDAAEHGGSHPTIIKALRLASVKIHKLPVDEMCSKHFPIRQRLLCVLQLRRKCQMLFVYLVFAALFVR